jgi:hypothetical protein
MDKKRDCWSMITLPSPIISRRKVRKCDECDGKLEPGSKMMCYPCYSKIIENTTQTVLSEFVETLRIHNRELLQLENENEKLKDKIKQDES